MNSSLRDLQGILFGRIQLLSAQLDNVTDPKEATKILGEMTELNHRITMLGTLLFRQQSEELETKVKVIRQEQLHVDQAINDINHLAKMLQVVSDFLALVDEALDFAKTLA
jgi:hypothetical protein